MALNGEWATVVIIAFLYECPVTDGVVRISRDIGGKESLELARLGFGEFFGEVSLLTGEKRSASVTALTDCDTFELCKESIGGIIEARPELLGRLAEVKAERLHAYATGLNARNHEQT